MKKYHLKFHEKQTVTLDEQDINFVSDEEYIKNVVAHTFGTFVFSDDISKEDIHSMFNSNKLTWNWTDTDVYPNGELVCDVVDCYERKLVDVLEVA